MGYLYHWHGFEHFLILQMEIIPVGLAELIGAEIFMESSLILKDQLTFQLLLCTSHQERTSREHAYPYNQQFNTPSQAVNCLLICFL